MSARLTIKTIVAGTMGVGVQLLRHGLHLNWEANFGLLFLAFALCWAIWLGKDPS